MQQVSQTVYALLFLVMVLASFFHMQAPVLGLALLIILPPVKHQFAAIKMAALFAVLFVPAMLGLIAGYQNSTYLILKDFYYFSIPVLFVTAGIVLSRRIDVELFLKTIIIAGVLISFLVTGVSVSYMGLGSLTDPYSAHYAIGIVGTPAPPLAFACLLFSWKFNIRLFRRALFRLFLGINAFGIYMFASRTYLIITLCFVMLLVVDKIRKVWIFPVIFLLGLLVIVVPFITVSVNSDSTFINKIMGSFNEVSIGNYNTEQDINLRYRGYESFMALRGYLSGGMRDWIFGGLGKLIDLKTFVRLGEDTDFQYIPVLHNGWLYILVKTGAVGVLVYMTIFFGLIVTKWKLYADAKSKPIIRMFSAFIIGSVLSLLLTNYIVTAFFNMEMSIVMVTLGYSYLNLHVLLHQFKARQQQQQQQMSTELAGLNIY
ncbi:hypothetical protein MTO98_10235 [Mucilaginibacter sp. SMC90]|uniref:hypothetical protein n=1 Tax=Mucilaginibacter sp. SMC90 TaxID=2929803 RepID=UPI001FB2E847|nr:hypothetical protein [Mucilaginibacter sp. SMC90]UOE51455.1 hypothetical protein MTO98_10235 [Mucilaginibacter sp. SMC90]